MTPSLRACLKGLRLPIRTSRLDLVAPESSHVTALVPLLNDPTVARWTLHIPNPYTVADARRFVRRARAFRRTGGGLRLVMVRRSDRALVGGIGLHHTDEDHASAEIGYWLGRPYRGHGYGSEAARAVVKIAFQELGLHRVEAAVFPGNAGSIRLLRRVGFRYEGRARDAVLKDGKWRSDLWFSVLATDRVRSRRTARKP